MFEIFKSLSSVAMFCSGLKKLALLVLLSFTLTACGDLIDVNRISESDASDASTNVGTTIYWAPMTVNGQSAETYRVLYGREGERPSEVSTTTTEATLTISSLSGYTVYIEAFNNDRNSVFELYSL